jgi:LPS-assembly lipoprotein
LSPAERVARGRGAWLVTAVLLVALAGCGFRPMYGRAARAPVMPHLQQIAVEPIPERVGHRVWNNLLDRLNPTGTPAQPRYRLQVELRVSQEGLAVRGDTRVTRNNYRLIANFRLRDASGGELLYKGRTFSIAAYNLVDSEFANISAEKDAERRTAREISDEIRDRLAMFFEQHN